MFDDRICLRGYSRHQEKLVDNIFGQRYKERMAEAARKTISLHPSTASPRNVIICFVTRRLFYIVIQNLLGVIFVCNQKPARQDSSSSDGRGSPRKSSRKSELPKSPLDAGTTFNYLSRVLGYGCYKVTWPRAPPQPQSRLICFWQIQMSRTIRHNYCRNHIFNFCTPHKNKNSFHAGVDAGVGDGCCVRLRTQVKQLRDIMAVVPFC